MDFPTAARLARRLAFACLLTASLARGESLQGTVLEVAEGDIITVVDARKARYKIRLAGIDAPEPGQPFGPESRRKLADLLLNKKVSVERRKEDIYGRIVARVLVQPPGCGSCASTRDAALAQLEAGLAWWYREERREQPLAEQGYYEYAEFDAQARRIGLWADAAPCRPGSGASGTTGLSSRCCRRTGRRVAIGPRRGRTPCRRRRLPRGTKPAVRRRSALPGSTGADGKRPIPAGAPKRAFRLPL